MDTYHKRLCNRQSLDNDTLKFTLSLYDNPMTPRSDVQKTIECMIQYVSSSFIPFIKKELNSVLSESVPSEVLGKINCTLDECKFPFKDFETETARFNIYDKKCGFKMPKKNIVGKDSNTGEDIEVISIPVGETLKNFLELPGVYKSIRNNMEKLKVETKVGKYKVVGNIMEGEMYKKHYAKDDGRNAIPLFFSYDDAQARGPLTPHADEEKLGLGYVTIPVLDPHLVAKLDNVFLVLVFLAKHKAHLKDNLKNISIFGPLIEELKELSVKGINITIDGVKENVYFDCLLFVGDNLAQNEVCGFVTSFNANYYCRICYATSAECKEMFKAVIELMRNEESYAYDVQTKSRGVLEECIFNRLPRYHIVRNRSLDLMHDLLEGEGKDTAELVLTEIIIVKQEISLEDFNKRLKNFDFGYESSNRPRPLKIERCSPADAQCYGSSTKIKAKQSASQMACLLRYLPFILDDLIPINSDSWKLYIILRKIIGLVTSPEYIECDLYQVEMLIEQFLSLFSKMYRMKPKPHFMVHIPLIMQQNGPLIHFWSMSTERKHRFARQVALGTSSSRDLPWTIGVKYQLSLCLRNQRYEYDDKDYELGPTYENDVLSFQIQQFYSGIQSFKLYKYITLFGHRFSDGTVFVQGCDANGQSTFFKLKAIVEINNLLFFYVCTLQTERFVESYHAYEIKNSNVPNRLIALNKIERKPPCLMYKRNNNQYYVACRYD